MNIFVNISHPAHVHFFKGMIQNLKDRGHFVLVGARDKDITLLLLREYRIEHVLLTRQGKGALGLMRELLVQQVKVARLIRKYRFDLMLQLNGIFNAPVGRLFNVPTLAFTDTENARLDNQLSFYLSRHVFLTSCFDHTRGGHWKKEIHYPGYHELAYLTPRYADKHLRHGLPKKILIRFVSWEAGHDIGEEGIELRRKLELIELLQPYGEVCISSEAPLPPSIAHLKYPLAPGDVHRFMAQCHLVVGESATMASEAACMGIPAVFISNTGRGYTTELDQTYRLIRHFRLDQWDAIKATVKKWAQADFSALFQERRQRMLADKIEVSDWLTDLVLDYPHSVTRARKGAFSTYAIKRPYYPSRTASCAE